MFPFWPDTTRTVLHQLCQQVVLQDRIGGKVAAHVNESMQRAGGEALDVLPGGSGRISSEAVEAGMAGLEACQVVQETQLVLVGQQAYLGWVKPGRLEIEGIDDDQHGLGKAPGQPAGAWREALLVPQWWHERV